MSTTAVVLIVVGTLAVLYVAARTSRTPQSGPRNHTHDAQLRKRSGAGYDKWQG